MQRAGFILTGGRSSRMGRDKALLPWEQTTVVEHLAHLLQPFTTSVTLIGEPSRYKDLDLPCVADLRPGQGPLAGLETALSVTAAPWSFILPCDVPGISAGVLSQLCENTAHGDHLAVVVRDHAGHIHPLCGLYRRDCLGAVRHSLNAGERRVMNVLEKLRPLYVDAASVIHNMNTPEDRTAALSLPRSHGK